MTKLTSCILFLVVLVACNNTNNARSQAVDSTRGLKEYYRDFFPIGVSVSPQSLRSDESALIANHFNSITAENVMKMGLLQPMENAYHWKDADSIVAFARKNKMKVRGHTLVWHRQTPSWLFTHANGDTVSKDILMRRLKDHITTVVSRYKNDIYAWDVVNEAISDDKDIFFRQSPLFRICGEEFIAKAFEWAHAADPDAILFYNDYNETDPVKRKKIISLIRKLRAAGVPVHAVGLQGHWNIYEPTKEQLAETLEEFASLRLPIQVTELDISIYPKEHSPEMKTARDFDTSFNSKTEKLQVTQYKMVFDLLGKYRQHVTGVTFWNVSDKQSWLDNFPIKNRKDYPLLFDRKLKPKKAYWEVALFNE